MRKSGVYFLVNTITGVYYVGSSVDITRRISEHLRYLRLNTHYNIYLQRAFNKYNEEAFSSIYIEIDTLHIRCIEQSIIDNDEPKYNVASNATFPVPKKGRLHKDADLNKYNFYHIDYGHIYCDCFELRQRYSNLSRVGIRDLILGRCKSHYGWRLARTKAEYHQYDVKESIARTKCQDINIYTLSHDKLGAITGNRKILEESTKLSRPNLSRLINGKVKISKGWSLV